MKQTEEALAVIYRQHSQGYLICTISNGRFWILTSPEDHVGRRRPSPPLAISADNGIAGGVRSDTFWPLFIKEVVVQQVFSGNESLPKALQPLVEAAESVLELGEARRRRTILRIDAGGGTVEHVNWLLKRGYHLHCKDCSGHRAEKLAASVQEWFTDPEDPNRQFGWVTLPTDGIYVRSVRRIAVRYRK